MSIIQSVIRVYDDQQKTTLITSVTTQGASTAIGVDGLDESVKEGKWVSATDSGISISVGNKDIIEMM